MHPGWSGAGEGGIGGAAVLPGGVGSSSSALATGKASDQTFPRRMLQRIDVGL